MTAPADALAARYTRDQLRAMCRTRGLPTGGTKAQLAGRLVEPDVTPPVLVRPMIQITTRRAGIVVIAATVNDHRDVMMTVGLTAEGATRRLHRRLDRAFA